MKISRLDIEKDLTRMSSVANSNSINPVLSCVLIEPLNEDKTRLTVTDLKVLLAVTIKSVDPLEKPICVNCSMLSKIISSISNDNDIIDIKLNDDTVKISSGTSVFKLYHVDTKDFPLIPKIKLDKTLKINSTDFLDSYRKVKFAVNKKDMSKRILSGVNFKLTGNTLKVQALDGRKASRSIINIKDLKIEKPIDFTIDDKALSIVSAFIDSGELSIEDKDSSVFIEMGNKAIRLLKIDGKFPETDKIFENPSDKYIALDTESLIKLINRAKIMCHTDSPSLTFLINNNKLTIKSNHLEYGEMSESMGLLDSNIDKCLVMYNYVYLLNILSSSKKNKVKFFIDIENESLISKGRTIIKDSGKDESVSLVMPLRSSSISEEKLNSMFDN